MVVLMLVVLMLLCFMFYIVSSVFFFFFKQKTAYEMRISDWSSDVCSSDLCSPLALRINRTESSESCPFWIVSTKTGAKRWIRRRSRWAIIQIGRASCRERVCQYV